MARPSFQLSDQQARVLVMQMPEITQRHATNRGNRDFVLDFMRAVYSATGQIYSPAIYRRLLNVYAPDRRPSTETLALVKKALEDDLRQAGQATSSAQADASGGESISFIVRRAVEEAMAAPGARPLATEADPQVVAQRDFLQERLAEAERVLAEMRTLAARSAADAQSARAERDVLAAQLAEAHKAAERKDAQFNALTTELEGLRRFAIRAVDDVRAETRVWQDRHAAVLNDLNQAKRHLEYFRQIAYQRGAAIPPELRSDEGKGATR